MPAEGNGNESKGSITRRRFLAGCGALAAAGVAGGFTVRELRTVHPSWPPLRQGETIPTRPGPDEPVHHRTPFLPAFEQRRQKYLEWVTDPSQTNLNAQICSMATGKPLNQASLQGAMDRVNTRVDSADFAMLRIIRINYMNLKSGLLVTSQKKAIKQAILNFKYWLDEPNPTLSKMEFWTENHQISIHSSEYLAGQLFPDELFTNNKRSGRWRMEHARSKILKWLSWRASTGFAEWDSVPYYRFDMAALLNLIDFAEDDEIVQKATIILDQMLLCIAADSFYGMYGTSMGRSASHHIKSIDGDNMATAQALLWGLGAFRSKSDILAAFLATSENYRIPPVLEKIGQDVPGEMTNKERHSINVTQQEAEQLGLRFDSTDEVAFWWGMHAFTHPKVIHLTMHTIEKWKLWHYPGMSPLRHAGKWLSRFGLLKQGAKWLGPDSNGMITSQVNKVTYRTPDYMLSCAQDYRKGEKGFQQHIWQATLDPYAVVFVTNPGSLRERDRPGYWDSQGRFPRAAQHRNVLISIYNIDRTPDLLEGVGNEYAQLFAFTHAYFPRWAFDEINEIPVTNGGGWILGRRDKGYIALYSHLPYGWQTKGPDAGQEIIAPGRENVWICQLGREGTDGSFEDFYGTIARAEVKTEGLQVSYNAPGAGQYEFGWEGPLKVAGEEISLRDYPRFGNPYCQAEFGQTAFDISLGEHKLELDFEVPRRVIT